MKRTILISIITLLGFSAYAQQQDNTLTTDEFTRGWILLFDGKSLDGWKAYNGAEPQAWKVDGNAIYCDGTKGGDDLMTIEQFGDFDLKFEWKIPEGGNSGVIYMVREGDQWSQPYLTGPEYQVFGEYPETFTTHSVGAFYDVYPPTENKKLNPPMEWNSGRIRVSDGLVTHWVNDEIVMQCELYSEDWNKRVAESKWNRHKYFGKSPFGHIDFQNHGSEVWYKNVKIRKLD